jgi:hypothetical protein
MIEFDKHAGTHFRGKRVRTSQHAREQTVEEFRVPLYEAHDWIIEHLAQAQFIGSIYSTDGKQVRLFGYKRIAFILASETDLVITVYARHEVNETLRNPLEELVKSTVRQATSRLVIREQEGRETMAAFQRLYKQAEENNDVALMKYINCEIKKQETRLHSARQEHAKLLKGVVAYV